MKDLDQLLRSWNERNEPFEAHFEDLRRQVMAKVASQPVPTEPISAALRPAVPVSKSRGRFAVGFAIVASVLLVIGVSSVPSLFERKLSWDPIQLISNETAGSQSLFQELESMFDGRWKSLSEINGNVQLQTDEPTSTSSEPGVAVRLTVMRRQSPRGEWKIVWQASVISHTEEWVQLPKDLTGENSISVWTHSLPDGSVLVESDMALRKPVSIQLATPTIVTQPSQPTRLWSGRQMDAEFQLIQSVSRLEANRG